MGNLSIAFKPPMSTGVKSPPSENDKIFLNMINHSPAISENKKVMLSKQSFKRPPLPSIHLTSSKHVNQTGETF